MGTRKKGGGGGGGGGDLKPCLISAHVYVYYL